jgi:hypothetical protein
MALVLIYNASLDFTEAIKKVSQLVFGRSKIISRGFIELDNVDLRDATNKQRAAQN